MINFKKIALTVISLASISFSTMGAVASADASAENANYQAVQTTATVTNSSNAVVNEALKLSKMNIPYVWGGESLSGMDCSGFTDYVYQKATGKSLGHYTVTQEGHVTKKAVSQAQPGDLLFWGSAGATYHVGIYIGNGQFVAAPQPGQNVGVENVSSFMPSFAGTVN